jgi:hypothetical protein
MNGKTFEITSEMIVQYLYLGAKPPETLVQRFEREFCCWLALHPKLRRILHFFIAC